jgi:hypothetical protein
MSLLKKIGKNKFVRSVVLAGAGLCAFYSTASADPKNPPSNAQVNSKKIKLSFSLQSGKNLSYIYSPVDHSSKSGLEDILSLDPTKVNKDFIYGFTLVSTALEVYFGGKSFLPIYKNDFGLYKGAFGPGNLSIGPYFSDSSLLFGFKGRW